MSRRGRPPYPDVLTPREWEVLDLLRQGLTNQQIADRLGISIAGARYHVSEILAKLGVSTREEAAEWTPAPAGRRFAGFGFLLAPVNKLASAGGAKLAAGVVIVAVAAIVGVLVLAVFVMSGRDKDGSDADVPLRLVGPLEGDQMSGPALADLNAPFFVLDVETAALYALPNVDCGIVRVFCIRSAEWSGKRTLRVQTDEATYSLEVPSGRARFVGNEPAARSPKRPSTLSKSGRWTVTDEVMALLVGLTGSAPKFRLTSASSAAVNGFPAWPQWSPRGDVLAFVGNYCSNPGWDVFVFDPGKPNLTRLTNWSRRAIVGLAWRPDGQAIAVGFFDETRDEGIVIVPTSGSGMTVMLQGSRRGFAFVPQSWSSEGRYLLLGHFAGGFCESIPKAPQTELEMLTP